MEGTTNERAKYDFIKFITENNYEDVEAFMGYFRLYNKPERLNYTIEYELEDISPLMAASEYAENFDILELLLENGADINYSNENGTALHFALTNALLNKYGEKMDIIVLKYLLDNGANPFIKDKYDFNPLEIVISAGLDRDREKSKKVTLTDILKHYMKKFKNTERLQRNFREKRTRKRNLAASRIQSRTRGNLSRRRLTRKKAWRGTEAFDPIMYDDEDIFEYLQSDPKNFVIQLPGGDSYEAVNLNDYLKMNFNDDLHKYKNIPSYNKFFECRKYHC